MGGGRDVTSTDVAATVVSDSAFSGHDFLNLAGALWAFYGLALFTILKELVVNERKAPLPRGVLKWILPILALFFAANFGAIALFQTDGLKAVLDAMKPAERAHYLVSAWSLHGLLLFAHLAMSTCVLGAVLNANRSQPLTELGKGSTPSQR
jgi:hypothetical protein